MTIFVEAVEFRGLHDTLIKNDSRLAKLQSKNTDLAWQIVDFLIKRNKKSGPRIEFGIEGKLDGRDLEITITNPDNKKTLAEFKTNKNPNDFLIIKIKPCKDPGSVQEATRYKLKFSLHGGHLIKFGRYEPYVGGDNIAPQKDTTNILWDERKGYQWHFSRKFGESGSWTWNPVWSIFQRATINGFGKIEKSRDDDDGIKAENDVLSILRHVKKTVSRLGL